MQDQTKPNFNKCKDITVDVNKYRREVTEQYENDHMITADYNYIMQLFDDMVRDYEATLPGPEDFEKWTVTEQTTFTHGTYNGAVFSRKTGKAVIE